MRPPGSWHGAGVFLHPLDGFRCCFESTIMCPEFLHSTSISRLWSKYAPTIQLAHVVLSPWSYQTAAAQLAIILALQLPVPASESRKYIIGLHVAVPGLGRQETSLCFSFSFEGWSYGFMFLTCSNLILVF